MCVYINYGYRAGPCIQKLRSHKPSIPERDIMEAARSTDFWCVAMCVASMRYGYQDPSGVGVCRPGRVTATTTYNVATCYTGSRPFLKKCTHAYTHQTKWLDRLTGPRPLRSALCMYKNILRWLHVLLIWTLCNESLDGPNVNFVHNIYCTCIYIHCTCTYVTR